MSKIALERATPSSGKLDHGATGVGSSPQLSFELFKAMTGIDVLHIAYKSAALAQQDLMAGRVASQTTNLPNHIDTVRHRKIRALSVTTSKRSAKRPEVPTIAEQSVPECDVSSWCVMCAPVGVGKAIQARIETDSLKLLGRSEIR